MSPSNQDLLACNKIRPHAVGNVPLTTLHAQIGAWQLPRPAHGDAAEGAAAVVMMLGLQHQQHRASSRSALRRGTRVVARRGRRRPGMYMQHGRAPLKGSTRSASRCVPGRRGERRRSRRGRTRTSSVAAHTRRPRAPRDGHKRAKALALSTCSTDCLAASSLTVLLGSAAPRAGTRTGLVAR